MTLTAVTVQLGSIVMNGSSADGNGIVWDWTVLEGWWDSAEADVAVSELPTGGVVTVARNKARQISLEVNAHRAGGIMALGDLAYTAIDTMKRAADQALVVPVLLTVTDPHLALQSYVRQPSGVPMRSRIFGPTQRHSVNFLVPLMAPDPRRYSTTLTTDLSLQLTGTGTTVTQSITNAGDATSPPIITIDGPATNPTVTNLTISTQPSLRWTGTLGGADTLVIDVAAKTVEVNGSNSRANLSIANWWELVSGINSVRYTRSGGSGTTTAQLVYRSAYS